MHATFKPRYPLLASLSALTGLIILIASSPVRAAEPPMLINPGIDGTWLNASGGIQGLFVETDASTNSLLAFWFTYARSGSDRDWLVGTGAINGAAADLTVFSVEGGQFGELSTTDISPWGSARIEFQDCQQASFSFDSPQEGIFDNFQMQRLFPATECVAQLAAAHQTYVTQTNRWLDATGTWVFDYCVNLEANLSHGREEFRFAENSLEILIDYYAARDCQGAKTVETLSFELYRKDTALASLGDAEVVANRVLLIDPDNGETVEQIFYFDDAVNPPVMTHGNFTGTRDVQGWPATLHNLFATPLR